MIEEEPPWVLRMIEKYGPNWNGVQDCVFTVEQCNQAQEDFERHLIGDNQ